MIIDTLITDRTQADVDRLNALLAEGFPYWTDEELYFWLYGEPEPLSATDGDLIDSEDDPIIVGEGVIRGAYNEHDLNRVGKAVRYLADKIQTTTRAELSVTAKTDWTVDSIPTVGDMSRYLTDIRTIRNYVGAYPDTPSVPSSMKKLNYNAANDIERILIDANRRLDRIAESWRYSGELYAGEV